MRHTYLTVHNDDDIIISSKHITLFSRSKVEADSELTFGFVCYIYKSFIEWLKHGVVARGTSHDSRKEGRGVHNDQ